MSRALIAPAFATIVRRQNRFDTLDLIGPQAS
jgi:hypothetical protein